MKFKWSALIVPALLLAWTAASADDSKMTNKRLTGGSTDNKLTVLPEDVLEDVSHAEHAFTDMMKFYVPAQLASGDLVDPDPADNVELGVYRNIELEEVETLTVAKPLVSVFLYGPAIEVPDTAFAHSFMDVFAAVSLDDGLTSKKANLSESANESSFTLGVDGVGGGHSSDIPADHTQIERNEGLFAFHAPGMDYPYTNQCTDCHGATLEGGHHREPSCYSCHGIEWEEEAPDGVIVVYIEEAYAKVESAVKIKLMVDGEVEGVDEKTTAELYNGVTGDHIATEKVEDEGEFEFGLKMYGESAPCAVMVEVEGVESAVIPVIDKNTNEPIENCEGEVYDLTAYPGGAYNVFHATVGNKVLVAWPSRYCKKGQPAYSFAYRGEAKEADIPTDLINKREELEAYLGIDVDAEFDADLYLTDLFGVAGSQRSIDFAEEGYPQAGEVPHGCVWTARGVLLAGDDPRTEDVGESTYMIWTKPERLTSGRRDPNRIEVKGVQGAGFVVTWQEDPDGLRPGQGLGPGEGWSGAVAHDKTDIWYSFIPWEHFDTVEIDDTDSDGVPEPVNIAEYMTSYSDQGFRPQVYVPMAVPMRLTNNDKCVADEYGPGTTPSENKVFSYCNFDVAAAYGLPDFCADTVEVPQGNLGAPGYICVADTNYDGQADLPNLANTASTRPRLSLQGYASTLNGPVDSAWVIVAAEESKGLGRYAFLPGGDPCEDVRPDDPAYNPDCGADIGKNQWYFSFDMGEPQTSLTSGHDNGLVRNLVKQGNLLNQPEVNWRTGEYYPVINTELMWNFGDYNYDLYNTEIARRSSLLVQPIEKAVTSRLAGGPGLLAMPSWKQGAMRQGGPADTMLRRIVLPDNYADGIDTNPYAFTNMACAEWLITAVDANPYYPDGICGEPATNLSSVVPDTCKDDETNASVDCPTVTFGGSTFGIGDTNPILQGYIQGDGNTTRVLTWHQCPSDGIAQDTSELEGDFFVCGDKRTDPFVNLKDQSWYNPLDISKGHRGFIDGDFVMFLYAWSPNWRLNAKGHDRYDLYVRRSFDGGATWTTTPADGMASNGEPFAGDGTVTCETYRSTVTQTPQTPEPHVCYTYPAGGNEQARNVTQHSRMKVTTLDPRYASTPKTIEAGCVDELDPTIDTSVMTCDDLSTDHDSDLRNSSRYFMVFETGDNKTVQVGEAEPWDLYYSRAESFGDDYVVWAETDGPNPDATLCYPSDPHGDEGVIGSVLEISGFCNEFDRMNTRGDTFSSEANLEANPDGSKLYGVWAQWVFLDREDYESPVIESDAMMRRIWWIDDWISDLYSWDLPGTNKPEQ